MKKMIASSLMILGLVGFAQSVAWADDALPKVVQIGAADAYIPSGFDSNSDAFAVESGIFPNGCYHWDHAEVNHVNATTHEIRSFAKVQPGMCIMVLIPFHKEVQLGKLAVGTHAIRFMSGDGTYFEKQLTIEQ